MARMKRILANPRFDKIEAIVVTDGERILGLGDQGAGGMGIPIGKLALYTACGGLHPATTLPIMLDAGTNNPDRLSDPLYIGWRHERVRGREYDDFIEAFVSAVVERWPHVLLQWEDFARDNATRLLERYRDRLCTFNDDIQGTAVVTTGTLLAAVNLTGVPLRDHRIAVLGGGSAGIGICSLLLRTMLADGVSKEEARSRFYVVDRDGLLVEGMSGLLEFQAPFAQPRSAVAQWQLESADRMSLGDVVRNAHPTVLVGVSGQPGGPVEAARISDGMLMAAARALADISPSKGDRNANLLPPVTRLRDVSYAVALAVGLQAQAEGFAEKSTREQLESDLRALMWTPLYRPYRRIANP
jgi:malate dehydrogenase (oxaloacetate-decarboxylating)